MMTKTYGQKENLREFADKIETTHPKLGMYEYYNQSSDCYCIVGHMAKEVGVLDLITVDKERNGDSVDKLGNEVLSKMTDHFGLSIRDLVKLQEINDDSYTDNTEKVDMILDELDKHIGGN